VKPALPFVADVQAALLAINQRVEALETSEATSLREVTSQLDAILDTWQTDHTALQRRLDAKQQELEKQGLKVEAGEIRRIAKRMQEVSKSLSDLKEKRRLHREARQRRDGLLTELCGNRDELHGLRRSTLRNISTRANDGSLGLEVQVSFKREGQRGGWTDWLRSKFGFRSPRVERLAQSLSPVDMCDGWLRDRDALVGKVDTDGDGGAFFSAAQLEADLGKLTWDDLFDLETMRLEDRPRIVIEEPGRAQRDFDELSAGQQRSVLLSLLLVAGGNEPLIIDQPEDHLDAPFIATAIVQHLEAAKETRQLIIATHSANITVLGDAELVIPMYAEAGRGAPRDIGAVDRPETLRRVCELLEGGVIAYRRRGERYGFTFERIPPL
jgi:AAA domain, putative AbiEii toxin, Type IV TA system